MFSLELCFCTSCSGRTSLQKALEEKKKKKKQIKIPPPPSCKYFIPYKQTSAQKKLQMY